MRVKIKSWEKMEEEFVVDRHGHINCKANFVPPMEELIPRNRIIDVKHYEECLYFEGWEISRDMIEEYL